MVAVIAFFASCDPIVDEDHLKNNTTIDGVELIATQNAQGGNTIELKMNTPGVTGYWDYNLGKAFTDKVTIVYPIPGTSTFTFTGTLGSEFFSKTIDVTVDVLDTPLEQDWYDLVSEDTSGGKSWVYASDRDIYYYMSPPGGPDNAYTLWWNPIWGGAPYPFNTGKMIFDLNGAANYTVFAEAGSTASQGSFVLDIENRKLTIFNTSLLGTADGVWGCGFSVSQVFDIVSLTEDELVLYNGEEHCGSGWTYIFKPE